MFVIAHDFILRARIDIGEGVHAAEDLFELGGQDTLAALLLKSLPPLFKGLLNGTSEGFASFGGDLAHQAFSVRILDAERHGVL